MSLWDDECALVDALQPWLVDRGYVLVERRILPAFGDRLVRYTTADLELRISSDRLTWAVEIRPITDGANWLNLEPWAICLGSPLHDIDFALAPQVEYLRSHVGAIESACDRYRVGITLQCLESATRALRLSWFVSPPTE